MMMSNESNETCLMYYSYTKIVFHFILAASLWMKTYSYLLCCRFEAFIGDSKVIADIDIQPGGVYTLVIGDKNNVCIQN